MTRTLGGKQRGETPNLDRHRSRTELCAGASVCRCSQDKAAGAGLGALHSSLLEALAGCGTSGGRVTATADSHRHFLFSFILQIAAQSLNYSEQTPVTAPWSRGDTDTDGGCSIPIPRGGWLDN